MVPTIETAAAQLRGGTLSPVDLLESCFQQIDAYEAKVRAWVLIDREGALAQAREAAAQIKGGAWRGPLHGIPVGIKDIIDVFDWPTAAGSRRWAQAIARGDAPVVRSLRQAGAIIVGKTVTTQYASYDPSPTRNPWNAERTPGGSSSGSAAAVACGMCLGALATQTGGSTVRPASYCGVSSCKPTFGRVTNEGVVPLAHSMDHIGPMAGSVRGLAAILQTIAVAGSSSGAPPIADCWAHIEAHQTTPRLGRLRGFFEQFAEPEVTEAVERAAHEFRVRGAMVCDVALPTEFSEVVSRHRTVMAVEAAAFHEERLRRHPEEYEPCIHALLEEGIACSAAEYVRCKEHQTRLTALMAPCFEGFDALLSPATTSPAPSAAATGDPAFNSPWSYTGLPTISLPAGRSTDGMPLAIQLIGPAFHEADLLATAAWCETVLGWERRDPPR